MQKTITIGVNNCNKLKLKEIIQKNGIFIK